MCESSERQAGADYLTPTPRMVAVGLDVLRRSGAVEIPLDCDELVVAEIYEAMARCWAQQVSAKSG